MNITVIGLGYLGLTVAACLASKGHFITGIDNNIKRVESLNMGNTIFFEPELNNLINSNIKSNNIQFFHNEEFHEPLDNIIFITVGTPILSTGSVDLSQVWSAIDWIKENQKDKIVLLMKSTVPPGTGEQISKFIDVDYVSNPEFAKEGQLVYDWMNPDVIIIGSIDNNIIELIKKIYVGIDSKYMYTDITSAEMIKYANNAFLATKISFINEMALLCEKTGASIDDVSIGLAMDSRNGNRLYAGLGYGGSCLQKDIDTLRSIATKNSINLKVLDSVTCVNKKQQYLPLYMLKSYFNNNISKLKITILGLSFKPNTDDIRNAPALNLINSLVDSNSIVTVYDPQALKNPNLCLPTSIIKSNNIFDAVYKSNVLILTTEWKEFIEVDWKKIFFLTRYPHMIIDGRNALNREYMNEIGFTYRGIGRVN